MEHFFVTILNPWVLCFSRCSPSYSCVFVEFLRRESRQPDVSLRPGLSHRLCFPISPPLHRGNQTWLASAVFTHNSKTPACLFSHCVCVSLSPFLLLAFSDSVNETLTVPFILKQPTEFCCTKMLSVVVNVSPGVKLSLLGRPSVGEAHKEREENELASPELWFCL